MTLAGLAPDPEPESAWEWIVARAREFVELGPAIFDLAHEAAEAAVEAKRRGDMEGHAEGKDAVARIMALWRYHGSLADRLAPVVGLGLLPWVALGWGAATVVATAVGMRWVEARFGAEREIVALLERGELTSSEASALLAAADAHRPGLLSQVGTLAVVGLGVALWLGSRR